MEKNLANYSGERRKMAAKNVKNIKAALPKLGKILQRFAPQIRQQQKLLIMSFLGLMAEIGLHLLEPWPLK